MIIYKNAYIFRAGTLQKGHVLVENGKISGIYYSEQGIPSSIIPDSVIQCKDAYLLPGFIDTHVHLRGFQQEDKETPETGTKAALAGGVTTVLTMPNTQPTLSTLCRILDYVEKYETLYTNVGVIAGLSPDTTPEELIKMKRWGVFGLKIYPGGCSNAIPLGWPKYDYKTKTMTKISEQEMGEWLKLFKQCYELDLPILFHPQIPIDANDMKSEFETSLNKNSDAKNKELIAHSNQYSINNEYLFGEHIKSIIQTAINANQPVPQIHICHISTPMIVDCLKEIPQKQARIIYETSPHHMLLNYEGDFVKPSYGKVLCPLRDPETQTRIYDMATEGKFDTIGTDHAPHTAEQKAMEFYQTPAGFPGVELLAPLLLSEVFAKRLYLSQVVFNCCSNPASVFGIKNKGKIESGYDADFILVDKVAPYKIDNENLLTKSKVGPYHGKALTAKVRKVIIAGEVVYNSDADPDTIQAKGTIIKR